MRFLNYLLSVFWKKQPQVEIVRLESTALRVKEWRSQPELLKLADAVWRNQDFRLMLQVVQNECPGNFAVLVGDMETRALHQARTEGYNLALAALKSLRVPDEAGLEMPDATYEPEETK